MTTPLPGSTPTPETEPNVLQPEQSDAPDAPAAPRKPRPTKGVPRPQPWTPTARYAS